MLNNFDFEPSNQNPQQTLSPSTSNNKIDGEFNIGGNNIMNTPPTKYNNVGGGGGNFTSDDDGKDFAKRLSSVNQHLTHQANVNANHVIPQPAITSPIHTTTTTNNNINGNRTFGDDDYAAELQSEYNKERTQPSESLFDPSYDSAFDLPEIVTQSEDHHRFISLKRTATMVKIVTLFILMFSIMTYFVQAWWLLFSFGLVMCPVGFYSAHYFKNRMFLMFNAYLVVDIIFRLAYLFAKIKVINGFGIFLSIVIIGMEGYFTYFCWNFYKRLPRMMTPTLQEFFRQDLGLFSLSL